MRRMITAILGAVIFLVLPSTARADNIPADPIMFFLTFEGIPVGDQIDNYYGPDIHFTYGFIANGDYGPPCDREGGPCSAQLTSSSVIMDVYPGFENLLSFYYNHSDGSAEIFIYSGLDGKGKLLASGGIPPGGGMDWPPWGVDFSGTAHSVKITGNPGIEFTSLTNGGFVIPEPTSLILLATGVAGLAGWRRRRDSTQK